VASRPEGGPLNASRPLRVVQWTTGKIGSAAVRGICDHPALELVGCYAFSPGKAGTDVGELVGLPSLGIDATDDLDFLVALAPDCVVYTPYRPDPDHLERLLESGINVVTSLYMLAGEGYGKTTHERLEAAAVRGESTLYASGIYPGHAPLVALAASAMCTRIDRISVLESLDMSGYANEQMFRAMSIDRPLGDPEAPAMIEAMCGSFKEQIRVMAHALSVGLDDITFEVEFGAANQLTDFGFMSIRSGHIAGFKGVLSGMHAGRPVIQCSFVWKVGRDMTPDWPVENGYVLEIHGEPSVRLRLEPIGPHFDGALTTAMAVVNAIPQVVNAAPGILNTGELPLVTGAIR
jgi:hypothetical protein